jgi:cystathionine beta-lyase
MNDAELKHFFAHVAGVGLSSGTLFGESGSGYMRMNIGTSRHTIAKALDNIVKALA